MKTITQKEIYRNKLKYFSTKCKSINFEESGNEWDFHINFGQGINYFEDSSENKMFKIYGKGTYVCFLKGNKVTVDKFQEVFPEIYEGRDTRWVDTKI